MDPSNVRPFLRWPGGKAWLVRYLHASGAFFEVERVIEPFLGGGAISLSAKVPAIGGDVIEELIVTWEAVRDDPDGLVDRVWQFGRGEDAYLKIRAMRPRSSLGRAARFLYLNRTCWGGIYRENRLGDFNVPYGREDGRVICRRRWIAAASSASQNFTFLSCDFERTIGMARTGDLIFADPPYLLPEDLKEGGFRRYASEGFNTADFERLLGCLTLAIQRGVRVLLLAGSRGDGQNIRKRLDRSGYTLLERWTRGSRRPTVGMEFSEYLFASYGNEGMIRLDARAGGFDP